MKEKQTLDFYVSYNKFFLSNQLQETLFYLEKIYNILHSSMTHTDIRNIDINSRMRMKSINTGNSIELELIEGVKTVIQPGAPVIQVASAVSVIGITAEIIIRAAKGIAEVRKLWHEGTGKKIENENHKKEHLDNINNIEKEQLIIIPDDAKRVASDSAFHLINSLDYSPNIDLVKVNGTIIINKKERGNHL